ncbi:MAG: hypothetical protein U0168_26060 [Nannocystaceae bacterium]
MSEAAEDCANPIAWLDAHAMRQMVLIAAVPAAAALPDGLLRCCAARWAMT